MTIFTFKPRREKLDHADWQASTYKGGCYVNAKDLEAAIDAVKRETAIATKRELGKTVPISPWGNADLIDFGQAAHIGNSPLPPEGMVMFAD